MQWISKRNSPYKTIVAFSGEHKYNGQEPALTSAAMNGFPDAKIPKEFKKDPYRILIVADMFQTGFDEPLLQTMYVDKPLYDIAAVQTLSRLNRAHPSKDEVYVLDFANKTSVIEEAFSKFYRTTILSGETGPNKLYDLITIMEEYQVYDNSDVEKLVDLFLSGAERDRLDPILDACTAVYKHLELDDQIKFKSAAKSFVRTYGFLGAILPINGDLSQPTDIEKQHHQINYPEKSTDSSQEIQPERDLCQSDLNKKLPAESFASLDSNSQQTIKENSRSNSTEYMLDRFSALIQPIDAFSIESKHIAYTGASIECFLEANEATTVFGQLSEWLQADDILCWWGDQPALVFKRIYRTLYGKDPKQGMRVISPVFTQSVHDKQSIAGTPYVLARLRNILIHGQEHCAASDVAVLQQLLQKVHLSQKKVLKSKLDPNASIKPGKAYKKTKEQKEYRSFPYLLDQKTGFLHSSSCSRVQNLQNVIGYTLKSAIQQRYKPCSCCQDEYWSLCVLNSAGRVRDF